MEERACSHVVDISNPPARAPSAAMAKNAKYHLMTNASVVQSRNPASPTDQWNMRHM